MSVNFLFIFIFKRFYLFDSISRGSSREREKQVPCWARSLMWGSIPGPWDHDQSWRQMLNWLSHPVPLLISNYDMMWYWSSLYMKLTCTNNLHQLCCWKVSLWEHLGQKIRTGEVNGEKWGIKSCFICPAWCHGSRENERSEKTQGSVSCGAGIAYNPGPVQIFQQWVYWKSVWELGCLMSDFNVGIILFIIDFSAKSSVKSTLVPDACVK